MKSRHKRAKDKSYERRRQTQEWRRTRSVVKHRNYVRKNGSHTANVTFEGQALTEVTVPFTVDLVADAPRNLKTSLARYTERGELTVIPGVLLDPRHHDHDDIAYTIPSFPIHAEPDSIDAIDTDGSMLFYAVTYAVTEATRHTLESAQHELSIKLPGVEILPIPDVLQTQTLIDEELASDFATASITRAQNDQPLFHTQEIVL